MVLVSRYDIIKYSRYKGDAMSVLDLFDLHGKTAILTGAGQGLGKSMAVALAEAGADIVIADKNREKGEEAAQDIINMGSRAVFIETDVTDEKSVETLCKTVVTEFRDIDILVNNAGIVYSPQVPGGDTSIPFENVNTENWEFVLKVNLHGVFHCAQHIGKKMLEQKSGKIINIASMSGIIANWGRLNNAYCTSKGAVIMFTKELATEWGKYGIRVNAIAPGYIKTDGSKALEDPNVVKRLEDVTPLRRPGTPSDLKGSILFLASEASGFITGQTIIVDGGYTLW